MPYREPDIKAESEAERHLLELATRGRIARKRRRARREAKRQQDARRNLRAAVAPRWVWVTGVIFVAAIGAVVFWYVSNIMALVMASVLFAALFVGVRVIAERRGRGLGEWLKSLPFEVNGYEEALRAAPDSSRAVRVRLRFRGEPPDEVLVRALVGSRGSVTNEGSHIIIESGDIESAEEDNPTNRRLAVAA